MKSVIPVQLLSQAYKIVIASDGLDHLGALIAEGDSPLIKPGQKILRVSSPGIFQHYGQPARSFRKGRFPGQPMHLTSR